MSPYGPVPKRSNQRRRRNRVDISHVPTGDEATIPEPDPQWHPIAAQWFAALAASGQRVFYENSDWAHARYVAETMSRSLRADRTSAQLFSAVISASADLLTTEGARRRLRVELERASTHEKPAATVMADYRRAAGLA
jgi:hypothetical protein